MANGITKIFQATFSHKTIVFPPHIHISPNTNNFQQEFPIPEKKLSEFLKGKTSIRSIPNTP